MNAFPTFEKSPCIILKGKWFCITGKFDGYARSELEAFVERNGGTFTANVSKDTDYLIIGSKGTRCCSFACCSRVVEKAVELRQRGASLKFIKESDFILCIKMTEPDMNAST